MSKHYIIFNKIPNCVSNWICLKFFSVLNLGVLNWPKSLKDWGNSSSCGGLHYCAVSPSPPRCWGGGLGHFQHALGISNHVSQSRLQHWNLKTAGRGAEKWFSGASLKYHDYMKTVKDLSPMSQTNRKREVTCQKSGQKFSYVPSWWRWMEKHILGWNTYCCMPRFTIKQMALQHVHGHRNGHIDSLAW